MRLTERLRLNDQSLLIENKYDEFDKIQGVLKALRRAGINIVAIHNHMMGESPRIIFLHFWGVGKTVELAKGLKSALDTQSLK